MSATESPERSEKVSPAERMRDDLVSAGAAQRSRRDALLLKGAVFGLVVAVVLPIVAYFMSHNTDNPLVQRDAIVIALIGVAVAVVSGAVFVVGSMTQFLRFWMARLIYEQNSSERED